MFPITDARGKVVAFGGRAMSPDARAKYLNSPETTLFHKGQLLYNLPFAREAARSSDRMVVVEGYMDVIALAQAGFGEAVAPLGTALTEQQILQLWRHVPEPILCFDGDNAGVRASGRAVERVLHMLKPAHSLRFAYLPQGEDPDSLVMDAGPGAFEEVLAGAQPLIDVLWNMNMDAAPIDTPERLAGFRSRLIDAAKQITDQGIRQFYLDEFGQRFKRLTRGDSGQQSPRPASRSFNRRREPGRGRFRESYQPAVSQELLRTSLAQTSTSSAPRRERLLMLMLINHPGLLDRHEDELLNLHLEAAELDKLHAGIIGIAVECRANDQDLESDLLKSHLMERGFADTIARLEADRSLTSDTFASARGTLEAAEQGMFELLQAIRLEALRSELEQAELDAAGGVDDSNIERAAMRARMLREQIEELTRQSTAEGSGFG